MTESEYSGFEEVTSLIYNRGYYDGLKVGRVQEKVSIQGNIKKAREEIEGKAFTEEIFDEDNFNSTNTESVSRETAECESYIDTEVVRLSDVLEILDRLIESEGVNVRRDF